MFERLFERLQWWHYAAVVVAACAVVYVPHLHNHFVSFDDGGLIFENPTIMQLNWWSLHRAFTTYDPELYIPLTLVAYQVIHAVFGLMPAAYHAASLLLHTANALLVLWLGRLLFRRWEAALTASVLFAIHPVNTEAVMWASGMKDVLSTLFFLSAFIAYAWEEKGERPKKWFGVSIALFALGLLAKVSVITLPIILILNDWRMKRPLVRATLQKAPFFVLCLIFGAIAVFGKREILSHSPPDVTVLLAFKATAFYLQKFVIPTHLAVIYPQTTPVSVATAEFFLPILVTLTLLVATLFLARRNRDITFCLGFFFITLVPNYSNFAKIGFLFFASDRYTYVASIGIFLAVGLGVAWLADHLRHPRLRAGFAGVLALSIALLMARASAQAATWHDTPELFRNVLDSYPSAIAESNLGYSLYESGDREAARSHFERAIADDPLLLHSYVNLAHYYREKGELDAAVAMYRQCITQIPLLHREVIPEDLSCYYYLGEVLELQGKTDESYAVFQQAVRAGPGIGEAYYNLGLQEEKRGNTAVAETLYKKTVALYADYIPAHYHLAGIYSSSGRLPEAVTELEKVVSLNPGYGMAMKSLNDIRALMNQR